ncbi:MAG: hypothetical protein A2748_00665 [Candidatus Wildermuthbacteria bacterium RIFCSPHIGHO2_01_FULL_45_20]|uniref:Response regulatory domain-containing protein n=1 Tax=Candidatus Wildermuthbacteria bacterium RIFCSPHIGHO2_02_FULL_45_25 TaxID=1802450 RepID=A0A1G2R6H8_9BACT|nr:MAG: hypothetical protein A2748_00665 [Candidatus Wildermuthbacteria bacterium RIFCSPHIGHO2_01_FULL_45_20]OHA67691.1 MAG: hypothetical protein A3C04_02125 [Candidatus Wildermuthbacteria bacterium RIFCSPHIGHO2_02_FULL_45_25]
MAKKILIVEDESKIAKAYADHLEREGYEIKIAADGNEGLEKARAWRPDLVLLDILLPQKDGLTVLRELKEAEETKQIPVIMLTNLSNEENLVAASKAGSVLYFVKANASLARLNKWIGDILR